MKYHHDKTYGSAKDFIYYFLRDPLFHTKDRFHANTTGRGGMIFRGQSDSEWNLLPTAFLLDLLKDFTPQPPHEPAVVTDRRRYLGNLAE